MITDMDAAVKIYLSEVKYEVKFDTWRSEKSVNDELKTRNKQTSKVNTAYDDDRAEDWLVRKIQDAIDNVYGECRWCIHDRSQFESDEILENPTEWTIHFIFADSWRGSVKALKRHVHRYICEYVLSQWYRAAQPGVAATYSYSADEELSKVYEEARNERVVLEPWRL